MRERWCDRHMKENCGCSLNKSIIKKVGGRDFESNKKLLIVSDKFSSSTKWNMHEWRP